MIVGVTFVRLYQERLTFYSIQRSTMIESMRMGMTTRRGGVTVISQPRT